MKRNAFTIIELLVVIAVISVLMTIVFSSARGALKSARGRQAEALCRTVQAALAAYHAQYEEWPGRLGNYVKSDSIPTRSNKEGVQGTTDSTMYVLDGSEVREMVKAIVDEARKGNPLMDISGLFVSRDPGEPGGKGRGMDFMTAVRGSSRSRKRMTTGEMFFGYPEVATGRFRRFKMVYSIPGDSVEVKVQ